MTIVEFLRARLDEDEAKVREAIRMRMETPLMNPEMNTKPDYDLEPWEDIGIPAMIIGPERALREVEAKRSIITEIESRNDFDPEMWGMSRLPARALLALAAVYADHPDYQPDWTS